MALSENNTLSSAFKTFFERETLTGPNFNEWYRSLRIVLRVADTFDYLYKPCPDQPADTVTEAKKAAFRAEYKKHYDAFFERETLTGANFNDWYRSLRIVLRVVDSYDYLYKPCPDQPLKTASEEDKAAWKAEYKKHNDVACLMLGKMSPALQKHCKHAPGKSVSAHVLEIKGYMDQLHALGKSYDNDMAINLINRSLNKDFGDFVRNFNMHCVGKTVTAH
uniref:Zinc finger, CCHC-type n=1 Tax=Tanacetum cinerariifolium TaxID=118510 RepID=A0A699K0U8_TANCI|nr:hypothetical protein [Tanacetum cinerariifolium]